MYIVEEKYWLCINLGQVETLSSCQHLASSHIRDGDIELPPQLEGKSAVEVLADFLRYLFQCARTFI
jgi:hypothetical protein